MTAMRGEASRQAYLDGLRGLASLMVAASHYVLTFQPALMNGDAALSHFSGDYLLARTGLVFFFNPDFAVAIFFILSGFVLAASVAQDPPSWPALALRRWLRLGLPVLGVTSLLWIALHLGAFKAVPAVAAQANSKWFAAMFAEGTYHVPLWKQVLDAIFTLFRPDQSAGLAGQLNAVLWTMPIEMQGSLVLFAVYCYGADLFRRRRGRVLVMLLAVPMTFPTGFYGFGMGVALFEARRLLADLPEERTRRLGRLALPLGLVLLGAGLWLGSTPFMMKGETSYRAFIIAVYRGLGFMEDPLQMHHLGAFCLVAAILLLAPVRWLLTTWICRYLGRISFMLYLVQIPALGAVAAPVFLHMMPHWGYEHRALLALGAYLASAIIFAELATRMIDKPSIRLSRRVTAREWGWRQVLAYRPFGLRRPGAGAE